MKHTTELSTALPEKEDQASVTYKEFASVHFPCGLQLLGQSQYELAPPLQLFIVLKPTFVGTDPHDPGQHFMGYSHTVGGAVQMGTGFQFYNGYAAFTALG